MLRAANQLIRGDVETPALVYRAVDWELFSFRADGSFGTKQVHLNEANVPGCLAIHNEVQEVTLAPGDSVYSSISSSAFTLHYTASMVWPNEVVGGRKMPSRSELYSLTLGDTRNIVESKDQWFEVTTISPAGSSAYRVSVGDKRGLQYAEPPSGKQWRMVVQPGDYVSIIGGGTVSVGVTVTELPPIDRLVKKIMDKLRGM